MNDAINKKFITKYYNNESFALELEKAAQTIYGCSYDSLQELPEGGNPSKHYLRKQYIKNKKFIGLPKNLKKLSNTNIYKVEQEKLIIELYKLFRKKKKCNPTILQLKTFINNETNSNKDNRKFIKKTLEKNKLTFEKKK